MGQHRLQADLEQASFSTSFRGIQSPEGFTSGFGKTVGGGVEGWAPGATYTDTDAASGSQQWTNTGTKTTAIWTQIADAGVAAGFTTSSGKIATSGADITLVDNDFIAFGSKDSVDGDFTMRWDGSNFTCLPDADDTGAFHIGNGTLDMDFKVFLGTATEYVEFDVGGSIARFNVPIRLDNNTGAAAASGLLLGGGTTADPVTTSSADGKFVELRCQTTATSGDNRLMYLRYHMNGAGGGECLRAFAKVDTAIGTARGAHISLDIDDSPAGSVTGLGVGVDAQLLVGNAALPAGGNYFAGQSEIFSAGSSSDVSAATAVAIHSFKAGGNATGAGTVLNALAFSSTDGAGDGKMIDTTAVEAGDGDGSLRILVDEGSGFLVKYLHYWDGPGS